MRLKRCLSAAVVVAFMSALAPASTWAEGTASVPGDHAIALRASIDRAVARAASDQSGPSGVRQPTKTAAAMSQTSGGGGGGHIGMIVSVIGTVAGLGMTYYVVKQMQKTTSQAKQ